MSDSMRERSADRGPLKPFYVIDEEVMPESQFNEGDTVTLKIAPKEAKPMVVDSIDPGGKIVCLYYEGTILRQKAFSAKVLKVVQES